MKKFLIPVALFTLIFSSCKTSQLESYQDDIYASPSQEKKLARIAAAEQAKKEAEQKQKQEADALAQKAKDDANPYYKDPQYNSDDYYDYKYASQLRRFNNPISGAGYYNNYYTNSYMYNQNPAMYGSSIYSSYNYWMPSNQFNNYASGLSMSIGTGYFNNSYGGYNPYYSSYNPYYSNFYYGCGNMYGGYNPYSYGYNPYAYNPYSPFGYAMGYSPYGMGYYNGFNSGYNWGYFNAYDVNSAYSNATYAPRGSNGGGNDMRQSYAGMAVPADNNARTQFINEVAHKQETTPKFVDIPHNTYNQNITNTTLNNGGISTMNNGQTISSDPGKGRGGYTTENYPNSQATTNNSNTNTGNTGFWPRFFGAQNNGSNQMTTNPVKGGYTSENINQNPNLGSTTGKPNRNYNSEPLNNNPKPARSGFESENNSFYNGNSNRSSGGFNSGGGGGNFGGGRGGSGGGYSHPR